MYIKKALSFGMFSKNGFLFNKKLTALFIFVSLSINGFAPSAAEVNRYSFVMVAAAVAQNTIMQVFEKCDLSLDLIAEELYADILSALDKTPLKSNSHAMSSGAGDESVPCDESQGSGIKQVIFNKKTEVLKDGSLALPVCKIVLADKLNDKYGMLCSMLSLFVVISFLMFIAAIQHRKKLNGENTVNFNILKTEFSV